VKMNIRDKSSVQYKCNLSGGLVCYRCWNQVLIQPNASGWLPGHYKIYLVNMFKENLDITYHVKTASGKSQSFNFPQYFLLTTAVTVQYGCNLIISIFYCRILNFIGNTHGNFSLGMSWFKHCIVRSSVICTLCQTLLVFPLVSHILYLIHIR
jgi:hypothetical protein